MVVFTPTGMNPDLLPVHLTSNLEKKHTKEAHELHTYLAYICMYLHVHLHCEESNYGLSTLAGADL